MTRPLKSLSTSRIMETWALHRGSRVRTYFLRVINYLHGINFKSAVFTPCSYFFFHTVRVCNCTNLGYCYMEPETHAWKFGLSTTMAILGGVLGFIGKGQNIYIQYQYKYSLLNIFLEIYFQFFMSLSEKFLEFKI